MGMNPLAQNMQSAGLDGIDRLAGNAMFPQSQMDKTQYAVSSQMPTGAEVVRSDYDPKTDPYTGLPMQPFKKGGLSAIRFEEGGQAFDPDSGNVKLQKLSDPNDPFSEVTTVDYTIPKDDIKQFVPSVDQETGAATGAGQYILKDGSTLGVDNFGIVQAATPGRNDYTLNKEGYYQPTGENLTWRGDQNMLYKKIGGVDVNVPGIYHKGGYQNPDGSLRVDANGVPVALAPNYLDSGFGKSGLADAAPYIMAATMMAATGLPVGFEGMVPASETLMGGLGALGSGSSAVPLSEITGSTFTGPQFAIDPTAAYTAAGAGAAEGVAGGAGAGGAAEGAAQGSTLKDAFNAYRYANLAKNVLGMAAGASGRTGVPGYGLNNNPAYSSFSPGTTGAGLPGLSTYEKTPWANMAPPITLSKLSDFAPDRELASGGIAYLGGYSDGGRLLKGPGDGMSDNIPASISGKQPARLADGEFVVPADVVSHLGNGSTDAGAKQLYAMMDKVRKARTGNPKQGKQINPNKFLPKG